MHPYRNIEIINGSHALAVKVSTMIGKANPSVFHNTCPNCKGEVGVQPICHGECGKVINRDEILKGYTRMKDGKQEVLTFTKEQVTELESFENTIQVIGSLPLDQIDVRTLGEGYYLLPRKLDTKKKNSPDSVQPYCHMVEGLRESGKVFQIKYTIGKYEKIGLIFAQGGLLILKNVAFDEQLKECDEEPTTTIDKVAVAKFKKGIEALESANFKTIQNQHSKDIEDLIDGKKPKIVKVKESSGMDFFD